MTTHHLSRRVFLSGVAAVGFAASHTPPASAKEADAPGDDYRIANGRIKHSVMGWCFNPMPTEQLMDACHTMGMPAMEGIGAEHYPRLRKLGMEVSLAGSHGFKKGPFTRDNHAYCVEQLRNGT